MATLTCVYDADPAPRAPGRHHRPARRAGRPPHAAAPARAAAKWLAGSVEHDPADMIAAAFSEAEARDPQHQRTWVVLADGAEHQLGLIRAEAQRRGVTVHIVIDLIHVLEYIWKAAWSLHSAGDPAAEDWVRGEGARGPARRQHPGRRRDHRRSRRRRPGRRPADRRRRVRPLPDRQGRVPALRPCPGRGLAHRHRGHRRSLRHLIGDRLDITGARWGSRAPRPSSPCAPSSATATSTTTGATT